MMVFALRENEGLNQNSQHQYHVPKIRIHNKKAFQSKANIFLANRCTIVLVNKFEQVQEGVLMPVGGQSWSWRGDP